MRAARCLIVTLLIQCGMLWLPSPNPVSSQTTPPTEQSAFEKREAAYRANNIGVALLEQYKAKEAVESFQRALEIKPDLLLARINLTIGLYYLPDTDAAKREAQKALAQEAKSPQPHYVLGLIARGQNRFDEAIAEFQTVLKVDPDDAGTNINLGQILVQQKNYPEAINAFRRAIVSEPYNETALYNLGLLLTRTGKREEGQQLIRQFQKLKQTGAGTSLGTNYLEGGHYAEAVVSTGMENDLVDQRTPDVVFSDITDAALPPFRDLKIPKSQILGQSGGDAALFDFDGDGDLDLIEVAAGSQRLLRNDGGKFVDVTDGSGDLSRETDGVAMAVVAGDYDNDEKPDLFVLRYGQSSLYHNDGGGRFSDSTRAARIPSYKYLSHSAALFDYDHDGDLDIIIAGGQDPAESLKSEQSRNEHPPNRFYLLGIMLPPASGMLLRNNGDGTFTDQTDISKLSAEKGAFAIVPTDYDNRRDVDILSGHANEIALWRNLRDGTFQNVAAQVGLNSKDLQLLTSVAVGDINKDGFPDFYFGKAEWAGHFAMSDGKGRFRLVRGPGELTVAPNASTNRWNNSSQLIDYDNDGLLDLVTAVSTNDDGVVMKLRVWRNTGSGWTDVSTRVAPRIKTRVPAITEGPGRRLLIAGDLDGDGDTDLIFGTIAGGLKLARNDGGNRNHSIKVDLKGRVSNRSAIQTRVEIRAGSLYQRLETFSASPAPAPADLIFGLGQRAKADALRVLWPAGILQSETEFAPSAVSYPGLILLQLTELDRKPSSCPYLYTWNGERFEFVTDFMGGGEMGYLEQPASVPQPSASRPRRQPPTYNKPDPDEYVRIRSDQLKEKDGRYELRVTNELEEALFVDRLQLLAVSHPLGTEVYPNEGMTEPPKPIKVYAARNARPPLSAVDEHGHDVLDLISRVDRRWPEDFKVDRIRGYAAQHSLTLKLDETRLDGGLVRRNRGTSPTSKRDEKADRLLLLLTGWTDYAWSSDNVAASQGRQAMKPPSLQVKDAQGNWRTVIDDIGIPVGRPQTVTVDLTGKFLRASRDVRIVTNMRIYWDQILFATSEVIAGAQSSRLDPVQADLHWRGFSTEITPDGREPFTYDYKQVSFASPWKTMTGRYTRAGDVRELLLDSDDMFAICRPGDEITLSFDASALRPLPPGWTRTFLLYADGFSKEMDINSASPDQLLPLPFHGMSRYPYAPPEHYPMDAKHREYLEKYNTRVVSSHVSSIDSLLMTER